MCRPHADRRARSGLRVLRGPQLHHVKQMNTRLECAYHAGRGLVKHSVGHVVQQVLLELKINHKVDAGVAADWRECPRIGEMLQRPLGGVHQKLSRPIQRDLACEAFLERTEADDEVGNDFFWVFAMDFRAGAPRHERRVIAHVRHNRE
jgi:hypothetical protein